jgi:hypothetical protein
MPKSPGAQTPAGGSGNSNDSHGKADAKPSNGATWPGKEASTPGVTAGGKQTGSNVGGHNPGGHSY